VGSEYLGDLARCAGLDQCGFEALSVLLGTDVFALKLSRSGSEVVALGDALPFGLVNVDSCGIEGHPRPLVGVPDRRPNRLAFHTALKRGSLLRRAGNPGSGGLGRLRFGLLGRRLRLVATVGFGGRVALDGGGRLGVAGLLEQVSEELVVQGHGGSLSLDRWCLV
jgi:hypothetical protein